MFTKKGDFVNSSISYAYLSWKVMQVLSKITDITLRPFFILESKRMS